MRSWCSTDLSLALMLFKFSVHSSLFGCFWQWCECQKQPPKNCKLCSLNTTSGVPGKSAVTFKLSLNLKTLANSFSNFDIGWSSLRGLALSFWHLRQFDFVSTLDCWVCVNRSLIYFQNPMLLLSRTDFSAYVCCVPGCELDR